LGSGKQPAACANKQIAVDLF